MIDDVITSAKQKDGYDKEAYIKKKREQKEYAFKLIDLSLEEMKTSPNFLMDYINIQSRFDKYSPRNAILVAKQLPTATYLKDRKDWYELKVSYVNSSPKKIIVLEPGSQYTNKDGKTLTNFNTKELIDISETNYKPNFKVQDKKLVLQALLHECPADIKAVDSLDSGKLCEVNTDDNAIYICRSDNYDEIISAVSVELAKLNMFEKTEELDDDKAKVVGYMLCKKYGIETPGIDVKPLCEKYSQLENKDIVNDLSSMKDVLEDMNSHMGQYLDDKTKESKNRFKEQDNER